MNALEHGQPPAPPEKKTGWIGVAGAGAVAAASKGKLLFGALKALPFAKMFLTAGTMGLTIFLYAMRSGWAFAAAFVFLIFVHEIGHAWAMRAAGIRASWPVFIPFLGAFISMKDKPQHPVIEAEVAFAGPVAGTAGALVCAAFGLAFHSPFFLAVAFSAFFLNLFNLIPVGFLDGARVARVLSRRSWIPGLLLLGGTIVFLGASPQLLLIGVMGLTAVFRKNDDLDLVTPAQRRTWAFRYFGLCFFLGAAMFFTRQLLHGAVDDIR